MPDESAPEARRAEHLDAWNETNPEHYVDAGGRHGLAHYRDMPSPLP